MRSRLPRLLGYRHIVLLCLSTSVMEPLQVVSPRWPDELAVGGRASLHSLLSQPEEDHAEVARLAPVEAERELVQTSL